MTRQTAGDKAKTIAEAVQNADKLFKRIPVGEETCTGCGEKVQVIQIVSKSDIFPSTEQRVGCKCEDIKVVQRVQEENAKAKRERIQRIFAEYSVVPNSLRGARLENYDTSTEEQKRVLQVAQRYVETFNPAKSGSLLFYGLYGVGKSRLSYSIVMELIKRNRTAIYIRVNDLLRKLRDTYRRDADMTENTLIKQFEQVDVLALDDLGTEYKGGDAKSSAESWAVSKIYDVIDARMGKANIFTTNLGSKELRKAVGERNYSRLQEDTQIVHFKGEDYRFKKRKGVSE